MLLFNFLPLAGHWLVSCFCHHLFICVCFCHFISTSTTSTFNLSHTFCAFPAIITIPSFTVSFPFLCVCQSQPDCQMWLSSCKSFSLLFCLCQSFSIPFSINFLTLQWMCSSFELHVGNTPAHLSVCIKNHILLVSRTATTNYFNYCSFNYSFRP